MEEKKPYIKPELIVLGDIQAITLSIGMGAIMDGGNPGNDKKSH